MSRKLFIPAVGTVLKTVEDWKFQLHPEYRNDSLYNRLTGENLNALSYHSRKALESVECEIPAGAELRVDRIYLRRGGADTHDFDSVTFVWQNPPKEWHGERVVGDYSDPNVYGKKKQTAKKHRFWAKLADVNKMVIE